MLIRPYKSVTYGTTYHPNHLTASQLIQQAYAPPSTTTTPEHLKRLQNDLFQIQKRPEAWGLVIPLLNHQDQNVQFFGAHTAQVKIARDWWAPSCWNAHATDLLSGMHFLLNTLRVFETSWYNSQPTQSPLDVANSFFASYSSLYAPLSQSVPISHNVTNPILWSSFLLHVIQLTSLALKLAPGHPSRWPDWILSCVSAFSGQGASTEHIHDFLAIVAEEMANADLLGSSKYVITFLLILAFIVCSYYFLILGYKFGNPWWMRQPWLYKLSLHVFLNL